MRIANETLDEMAHFDALTHLPNRVLLADRIQQAILHAPRRGKSVAVAFLDLDGFKDVNDKFGHVVGDKLLVSLSNRMKATLREGDTLARLGGDEFVAVLSDLSDHNDLEPFLKRLLAVASERVIIEDATLQVSASIGVTIFPQDGSSPEQLLRHADQAMYRAKQSGKNRFHLFDVAGDAAVRSHREQLDLIAHGMRNAEFVLFYQPQVDMLSGNVLGMEALVRWKHPTHGVLGPGHFLPALEEDRLGMDFGDMVLDAALKQLAQWQTVDGYRFKLSVNLFNQQIQDPAFADRLKSMLARYPEHLATNLKLEIVETNALADIAMVSTHMRQCTALGVSFAVDDFGTGYSSLTYLKMLPAQQLKIDQTFVRSMLVDREDLAIMQSVISLAGAFDREVIAEGVETQEQAQALIQLGCTAAQGFGIGKPMPESALGPWLQEWAARQPWARSAGGDRR
jgi:diguanylate cyclase (GGDEF)-like protein